jgi:hypothetical protein
MFMKHFNLFVFSYFFVKSGPYVIQFEHLEITRGNEIRLKALFSAMVRTMKTILKEDPLFRHDLHVTIN